MVILPNSKKENKKMDNKKLLELKSNTKILKAMSHPTRLFILEELSKCEKCVCELTEMIGVDISTISKHLYVLKNAGLVENEKRGLTVYYKLKSISVLNLIDFIRKVIKNNTE